MRMIKPTLHYNWDQVARYEELCRNEVHQTAKKLAALRCRYLFNVSPYNKINPLKFEEVHLDPDIFIYHDVIYDREIETMKSLFNEHVRKLLQTIKDFFLHFILINCLIVRNC